MEQLYEESFCNQSTIEGNGLIQRRNRGYFAKEITFRCQIMEADRKEEHSRKTIYGISKRVSTHTVESEKYVNK